MWWERENHLNINNNMLYIGKRCVKEIADQVGTPVYLYNLECIKEQYLKLIRVFKEVGIDNYKIIYALKANHNEQIVEYIRDLGIGIDASSPEEVDFALKHEFSDEDVFFTGNSLSNEDLQFFVDNNCIINFDSISALKRFNGPKGRKVGLRFNTGYGAGRNNSVVTGGTLAGDIPVKFGLSISQIDEAIQIIIGKGYELSCLHHHVGSDWLSNNTDNYFKAFTNFLEIYQYIEKVYNIKVPNIDLGGGYGVPHSNDERAFPLFDFFNKLKNMISDANLNNVKLIIEPGSFLISEAGILVGQVNTIESKYDYNFAGLNMGLNIFNSPALYKYYHEIVNCNSCESDTKINISICGNICEPIDMFAINRKMSEIKEGDYIAVLNAGAYGQVMSSAYNMRKKAREFVLYNLSQLMPAGAD